MTCNWRFVLYDLRRIGNVVQEVVLNGGIVFTTVIAKALAILSCDHRMDRRGTISSVGLLRAFACGFTFAYALALPVAVAGIGFFFFGGGNHVRSSTVAVRHPSPRM